MKKNLLRIIFYVLIPICLFLGFHTIIELRAAPQTIYWNPDCPNQGNGTEKQCAQTPGGDGSRNDALSAFATVYGLFGTVEDQDTLHIWSADGVINTSVAMLAPSTGNVGTTAADTFFIIEIDGRIVSTDGYCVDFDNGAYIQNVWFRGYNNSGYHNNNSDSLEGGALDIIQLEPVRGDVKFTNLNFVVTDTVNGSNLIRCYVDQTEGMGTFTVHDCQFENSTGACTTGQDMILIRTNNTYSDTAGQADWIDIRRNYFFGETPNFPEGPCHNAINVRSAGNGGVILFNEAYGYHRTWSEYDWDNTELIWAFNCWEDRVDSHLASYKMRAYGNVFKMNKTCWEVDVPAGCTTIDWDQEMHNTGGGSAHQIFWADEDPAEDTRKMRDNTFWNNTYLTPYTALLFLYNSATTVNTGTDNLGEFVNNVIYRPGSGNADWADSPSACAYSVVCIRNGVAGELGFTFRRNLIERFSDTNANDFHLEMSSATGNTEDANCPNWGGTMNTGCNAMDDDWTESSFSYNWIVSDLDLNETQKGGLDSDSEGVNYGETLDWSGWGNQPDAAWAPDKGIDAACMQTCGAFVTGNWSKCIESCLIDRDIKGGSAWDVGAFEFNEGGGETSPGPPQNLQIINSLLRNI